MHYNVTSEDDSAAEADLHTYMANPEVFTVKEGYVAALQGMHRSFPSFDSGGGTEEPTSSVDLVLLRPFFFIHLGPTKFQPH